MKRLSLIGLLLGALSAALFGCPVYDDSTPYCTPGATACAGFGGGSPIEGGCDAPLQCGPAAICGSDQSCHPGDCSEWGCPKGYQCGTDGHSEFPACEPVGQVTVTTGTSMGAGMKTTSASGGGSPGAGGAGGGDNTGGSTGGGNAGGAGGAGGTSTGGAPGTGGTSAGGAPGAGGGGAPGTGGAPT